MSGRNGLKNFYGKDKDRAAYPRRLVAMAKTSKPRIVSFYATEDLERIPKGQRSQVINAALRLFLSPDGEQVVVIEEQPDHVERRVSREEAIRRLKQQFGLQ